MTGPDQVRAILALVSYVSWTAAYVLMIRRGIKDKSFGMPIVAACIDVSWEFYFTFVSDIDVRYRVPNGLWFFTNLGVLWTCFHYGREDFEWPLFRRYFKPVVLVMLGSAFVLVFAFVRAFEDTYGAMSASFAMLVYSTLLPVMLIRRNSVKGQSLYIALGILIGDAVAVPLNFHAALVVQPNAPLLWAQVVSAYAVVMHVIYAVMVWGVSVREGLNPWRRA